MALPCLAAPENPKGPDADLRSLRARFRQALLIATLPEKHAQVSRLEEVEKQFCAARDYGGAIKVRDERLAMEQEITALELELPGLAARAAGQSALLPERVVFRPQEAVLSGLKLESDGSISGWEMPRGTAVWKLPGLPAGGYEVLIKYTCADGTAAALEVRESFYFLRGQLTAPEKSPVERNLGTLRISDGSGSLTLLADMSAPSPALRVIGVELAPVNR